MATKEEVRRRLQSEAFNELSEHHRVICNWGTSVGKSRVAINFIDYLDIFEDKKNILLLVAESTHKQNWEMEFRQALGEERAAQLLKNIRMECYQSLHKCTDIHYDLIVADEGHHLRSEKRIETLQKMNAERVLVLSATLSERGDGDALLQALNNVFGDFVTLKYELQQAINDGVLPTPHIDVIPLQMWDKAENGYESINTYLEKKKKEYLSAIRDTGFFAKTEEELDELKGKMLHAGSMRKQYLGRLKTKMAARILKDFEQQGVRYLCFCASIDQVEKLGGVNVINSKQSKKANKEVIDRFNAEEINSLFAVGMLQEGVSLKNIQAGLIVQLDGKARSFVQKFGRVMRSEEPRLKIIYVPESRDEDYLYNALKGVKKQYIHGWDIDEYITKNGIFDMKEISKTRLVGPPASYAVIKTKYRPIPTEIRGNCFYGYTGGVPVNMGGLIQGIFGGIMVDAERGHIYVNLFNKQNGTVYAIRTGWRNSLGLLMPLATAANNHHQNICIKLVPEGRFAKTCIWLNGSQLNWCKQDIPQDDPNKPESDRLNLVNNLIDHIQETYRKGIPAAEPRQMPATATPQAITPPVQYPAMPAPRYGAYPQAAAPVQAPAPPRPTIPPAPAYTTFGQKAIQQVISPTLF